MSRGVVCMEQKHFPYREKHRAAPPTAVLWWSVDCAPSTGGCACEPVGPR